MGARKSSSTTDRFLNGAISKVGIWDRKLTDAEVASLYARVLLKEEDPASVKKDVKQLKSEFQIIRYCFNEDELNGYPF